MFQSTRITPDTTPPTRYHDRTAYPMIDLRSDTVTKPTTAMLHAIAEAEVGDDVFHDDPTVLNLEARVAEILGKDDAVYVASGTMSNQIALRTHTEPGDVVIVAPKTHIGFQESGAGASLSGTTFRNLPSVRGQFTPDTVRKAVPETHPWIPHALTDPVKLLAVENTHAGSGGAVWDANQLAKTAETAKVLGLATHLDGARLWNATATTGISEAYFASEFDTVSVCFSKGLGAPIGSALAGSAPLIERARRFKQMFGGGFRQAGLVAAGALYALQNHRERMVQDHANAARLAAGLAETPGITINADTVETNLVYFEVVTMPADQFCNELHAKGVWMLPKSATEIRAVTHLDISSTDIDATLRAISTILR